MVTYGEYHTAEISCKLEMPFCWVIPEGYDYCASCSGCSMPLVFVLTVVLPMLSHTESVYNIATKKASSSEDCAGVSS